MHNRSAILALLFTVTVWGIGPVFIRTLSLELGPANHLVIRYVLVCVAYLLGLAAIGGWRIERRDWPRLLIISIVGLAGYNLGAAFGFELVPAGVGSLIFGAQPLFIALLGVMIAGETLSMETIIGLCVAFGGTILLAGGDLGLTGDAKSFLRGCVFVLLSTMAFAVYVVMAKPLVQKYGSYSVSAISTCLSSAFLPADVAGGAFRGPDGYGHDDTQLARYGLCGHPLHLHRYDHLELWLLPASGGNSGGIPLSHAHHRRVCRRGLSWRNDHLCDAGGRCIDSVGRGHRTIRPTYAPNAIGRAWGII